MVGTFARMSAIGYLRKNKWTFSSLGCVLVGLVILGYHNYHLAIEYEASRGKRKAVFGLVEWMELDKKVLVLILLIGGLMSLFMGYQEGENKRQIFLLLGLHVLAVYLTSLRLWIWMV